MNYIQKFQQGGTIASFSPNWELLKSKQISFFPSNFNSLMPMQNPAFSNKLMYNKTNTYLDEYNKLLMQQKVLSQKAKDPKIGKEK
jgi:hypothetical protein